MLSEMNTRLTLSTILLGALCAAPLSARTEHTPEQIAELMSSVNKQDAQSMFELAKCYKYGNGVTQDMVKSESLLNQSAEKNCAVAQIYMAVKCLSSGEAEQAQAWYSKAERKIKRAVAEGNNEARTALGEYEVLKATTPKSLAAGVHLLEQSAKNGDEEAMADMAILYLNGVGVEQSIQEAMKYAENASQNGSRTGKRVWGLCYLSEGATYDETKGANLIREAAESGDACAQLALADFFQGGRHGYEANRGLAITWLRKSADNLYTPAQSALGDYLLTHGRNSSEVNLGIDYLSKAADKNDADALILLGSCFVTGKNVQPNRKKGFSLIARAAESGNALAQTMAGQCCEAGWGTDKDIGAAIEWYEKAAGQDQPQALCILGVKYCSGTGVRADFERAEELFRQAQQASDPLAGYYLETIPSLKMADKGDYFGALQRMINLFSSDINTPYAQIVLNLTMLAHIHLKEEIQQSMDRHKTSYLISSEEAREVLDKFNVLKEAIQDLQIFRKKWQNNEIETILECEQVCVQTLSLMNIIREDRLGYVSDYYFSPYIAAAKQKIDESEDVIWPIPHKEEPLRQGVRHLASCASEEMYTAKENVREAFMRQLERAKDLAGGSESIEWKRFDLYSETLDKLEKDKEKMRGGQAWLPSE